MTVKEKKEKKQEEENKEGMSNSMNLAIIGGVVGAGIGLLSSPGTSKKVFKSLSESEVIKVAGTQLRRTAQEILAEQAQKNIKQLASGYMGKNVVGNLLSPLKKNEDEQENESSDKNDFSPKFDEMKEDNDKLNERLDKIENMLNNLVDSKK